MSKSIFPLNQIDQNCANNLEWGLVSQNECTCGHITCMNICINQCWKENEGKVKMPVDAFHGKVAACTVNQSLT